MRKAAVGALMAAGLLGACSTHQVPMTYNAGVVAQKPPAAKADVEVLSVTDARKHTGKHLGAIRGGYGNTLKTLEMARPANDVVRQAFVDGLGARGLLAQGNGARYGLDITVDKLDCSLLMRPEAHARFQVSVLDRTTGRPVYTKAYEDNRSGDATLAAGIFGSVEDLGKMANDSMQAAVDQALDNGAFLTVVGAR
ncbi:hypothetical protein [Azospirillum sp.]|uniref:hypothetical protein n=1 Tax=Azospirillum sp. TaxID=34012 RepID=UPI003D74FEC0